MKDHSEQSGFLTLEEMIVRIHERRMTSPPIIRLRPDHPCHGCVWASVQGNKLHCLRPTCVREKGKK
jgi:hypothetical protein